MKNENWSASKSKIYVSSKLPNSPASGYSKPDIRKVAVDIESDDDDFVPRYSLGGTAAGLLANIPSGSLKLTTGSTAVLDCGISLAMPPGYKCRVSSNISGLFFTILDSNRIRLNIINVGEDLILSHKQLVGKIWVEPVYFFDWITKG